MKAVLAVWFSVVCSATSVFGQEVPPAFEKKDTGDEVASDDSGEMEHDPFDPTINAPKVVRVQVEYIEMASTDLTRLMMDDMPETADSTALRMKVQAMVEEKKAKVIDTQMVVGRSGQKSQSESREECIYPTEFSPMPMAEKTKEVIEKTVASSFPMNPATPTAFETRNLGSNLESEPTITENDYEVDLRVLSSMSWHTGETVFHEGKDGAGNSFKLGMPEFYQMEINTSLTCISGQYNLLVCLTPKTGEGEIDTERKVMVFVKCDALPVIP